jgi:hypothetical protein
MKGFDKVVWTVKVVSDSSMLLTYHSADGEEDFRETWTQKCCLH